MQHELDVAIDAAKQAGAIIARIFHTRDFTVEEKEGGKGPLTEADLASNDILIAELSKAFPDDAILSEEVADDASRLQASRVWIIDPLDGTREFTLGIPEFVVSIGLSIDGVASMGVLYNPLTEELIAGATGLGVSYQGSPAVVSKHGALDGARFLVSRSEHKKGWFKPWEEQVELKPMGSVAYKLGLVAVGIAEASFTPKPRNEWDICGGVACILAAGGNATNGKGEPYVFNSKSPLHIGVCGTNGALHSAVLDLMEQVS